MIQQHYLQAIAEGRFTFGYSIGWLGLIAGALVLIGLAVFFYRRTTRPLGGAWKGFLISLRAATLLLLGFLLLEPGVLVSEVIPQETYLAVLVDDSESMSIQDQLNSPTRHQQVVDLLYERERIIERLSESFQVRTYRFSEMAQRLPGPEALTQAGRSSALSASIDQVMGELGSFPMAGFVLLTDGADNSATDPLPTVQKLADAQIPLFSVGIGAEEIAKDINIVDVSAEKSLLEGSIYTVQVTINQQGFAGQRTALMVTENGAAVAEQSVELGKDGAAKRYTLELKPEEERILVYELSIEPKFGETITQNNSYTFFVDNRKKKPLDILYIEGQPRNEYKFIQRALQGDTSLRLATYLQTGPRKFLRQGINSPQELADGFPATPEELFKYEGIIFGNIDPSFFNETQLQLLKDFVGKRGGGFIQVGVLDEAFVDSAVADIVPLELERESRLPAHLQGGTRRGEHPTGMKFPVKLTREGEYSPILRLDSQDDKNRRAWREMPELEGVYVAGRPKSGATVLMEHPNLHYQNNPLAVMAIQRYGAGRSMMLTSATTWRWQMLQPHEDQSHERLWRQISRWLTTAAPQRVQITMDRENYNVGDIVEVSARLLDEEYEPDNNGLLWLEAKDPEGNVEEVAMTWQLEREGTYMAAFPVEKEGVYDLTVRVPSAADPDLQAQSPVIVTPSRREFLQAGMDSGLLKRLATATNGKFYTAASAGALVADITYNPNAFSKQEVKSLWDEPIFLYLLIALVCIEWLARRYKGLS